MLNDEELAQYEQLLQEYKDVFAWGYQDMPGLDPNVVVHKLAVSKDVKPVKQPQRRFCLELTIQINAKMDKLIRANFIREVQYPIWLANIIPVQRKNGQLRIFVDFRDLIMHVSRTTSHYLSPNSLWMPLQGLVHCLLCLVSQGIIKSR